VAISDRIPNIKATDGATRRISAITIGVRHRRDLGDIEGPAASIAEVWLLHPVVITPGNVLIAGERRLPACAFLPWREVPVTVVDLDKVVKGEFAENSERKDLTLSEASRSSAPRRRSARQLQARQVGEAKRMGPVRASCPHRPGDPPPTRPRRQRARRGARSTRPRRSRRRRGCARRVWQAARRHRLHRLGEPVPIDGQHRDRSGT
jgi:ParB-like chromosome segregation protein Spo0J